MPATARPIISIFEEDARPHIKEPNSKIPKNTRKVHWRNVRSVDAESHNMKGLLFK
jgi:hypothetical protein